MKKKGGWRNNRKSNRAPQVAGTCIFCGSKGLTKEHVWGEWMKRELPPTASHGNKFLHEIIQFKKGRKLVKMRQNVIRPGNMLQHNRKVVCHGCNGGWMKAAVDATQPLLKAMMNSSAVELDSEAQKNLTLKFTASTIMAEQMDPFSAVIPAEDRRVFFTTKEPLPNWLIYIGRNCSPEHRPLRHIHCGGCYFKGEPEDISAGTNQPGVECPYQQTTFTHEDLVVTAFSAERLDLIAHLHEHFRTPYLVRIHPIEIETISWPCTDPLPEEGLVELAYWLYEETETFRQ